MYGVGLYCIEGWSEQRPILVVTNRLESLNGSESMSFALLIKVFDFRMRFSLVAALNPYQLSSNVNTYDNDAVSRLLQSSVSAGDRSSGL